MSDPLELFAPAVRQWFRTSLGAPTRAQALGWPAIAAGESTLLFAPTGSGKTLAAFLFALDRLLSAPEPPAAERCRVLYISPLKALAVDVDRNLRAPLLGIAEVARNAGNELRIPRVHVRTGDTPSSERARMLRAPPDILITTPESLYLLLTGGARRLLGAVETLIIDEIHALLPTKRGAHLMLSIERLEALRPPGKAPLQRVGLSATQRPAREASELLGGFASGVARPVTVLDVAEPKPLELTVEHVAMNDVGRVDGALGGGGASDRGDGPPRTIGPALQARLLALVRAHRTTIVFVNSRRLAERLAAALNELAQEELVLAHHGSVAREKRAIIEERLKHGELKAIVATSSLELGIDMGPVDLVVQVEAPTSVASGMQRIGRARHQVGGVPRGVIVAKHRGDLVASAAAAALMRKGDVEPTSYPRMPLDVLAQQLVAVLSIEAMTVDALFELVRRAAPFADLPPGAFLGVLDMLAGRYPSHDFAELRPRITWDRTTSLLTARAGAKQLALLNGGTIPDRGLYGVFLASDEATSRRVGELDEEMVFELREGETFLLGASAWRAERITMDQVLVTPASPAHAKMPFWHGDKLGRPLPLGTAIGALLRRLADGSDSDAVALLGKDHALTGDAARALVRYVREQQESGAGIVPTDAELVIERTLDEVGDHRICVLTPFGARVHAPWSLAVRSMLSAAYPGEVEAVYSDDGMVFRVPACDEPPPREAFLPASSDVEGLVTAALSGSAHFATRFRESAARALLLPRKNVKKRQPLWAQRKRAADLLSAASAHPSFPIVLEAYRECLRDAFDLPALVSLLARIEDRRVRVTVVDTKSPSPFATSVLFSFVGNFIYEGDAPIAERRLAALRIDHAQLRELLGEAALRDLLDASLIAEHEAWLQHVSRPARSLDDLADLLVAVGDLDDAELAARSSPSDAAKAWTDELVLKKRAARVCIAGAARVIAAEDLARYRDALGVAIPRGYPRELLAPAKDALIDLVARYARTHGPFVPAALAARFGLGEAAPLDVLERLVARGRVTLGAFLPGGRGTECCDAEVLRAIRQKSLARLRREVEPVDGATYARLLAGWQGVVDGQRGPDALLAAVSQLEGMPVAASVLEDELLPARVPGYEPWHLDALCASGQVVWAGIDALGKSDGRIALYREGSEALLARPVVAVEGGCAARIRELLAHRGAIFFAELARTVGGFPGEVLDALWSLVWSGEVTNDTFEPLRSLAGARSPHASRRPHPHRLASVRVPLAGSEGRWSLRAQRWTTPVDATERCAALARALLERYGIVTHEVAHAEQVAGGFSPLYQVFRALEEAGRIRRGYFVAGCGAAQFAAPGADERLRLEQREPSGASALVLAATDPANPYGALLPWPEREDADELPRPQRSAGALVILHRGALAAFLPRGERVLVTFAGDGGGAHDDAIAEALAGRARARRTRMFVETIDGLAASAHRLASALRRTGFAAHGPGLFLRGRSGEE